MPASDLVNASLACPTRKVRSWLERIWSNPLLADGRDPDSKVGAMELTLADSVIE